MGFFFFIGGKQCELESTESEHCLKDLIKITWPAAINIRSRVSIKLYSELLWLFQKKIPLFIIGSRFIKNLKVQQVKEEKKWGFVVFCLKM